MERTMSFNNYKRGIKRIEDQAIENARKLYWTMRYPFSWRNRGSWHQLPPRRHPGWHAYHQNQDHTGHNNGGWE
jgi:hypothetical protein